jgi:hypothetical protein
MRFPLRVLLVCALWAVFQATAWAQFCPGPQPEVEPNGTPATATWLIQAFGTTSGLFFGAPGAIAPAGDVDVFRILLSGGVRLWVSLDTGGPQAPGATTRDSVLEVLAPDATSVLEQDDDDGTGNGMTNIITSNDASVIAGLRVDVGGTHYIRVRAKTPGSVLSPYVLMVGVTEGVNPEKEPNDTEEMANVPSFIPLVGGLASPGDVDWYLASVPFHGDQPFVIVDGDPERDGTATDVVLDFSKLFPSLPRVDSSTGQGAPSPAAEAAVLPFLSNVRVSGPAAGTYAIAVFYSSPGCTVPVTLQSFEVH